jgi:type III pantothenate kinase
MVVGPGVKTGLNILMDNPATVGSDMIVCAVAALEQYKPPVMIVDMGTATTISVVDKNRNYIGGCIMPGVNVSLEAISNKTAQLPHISLEKPKSAIGKNTIDCMRSGVLYGNAAMIEGCIERNDNMKFASDIVERMEEEIGQKANVVVTGGLGKNIAALCKRQFDYDPELLIKGMYIIYKKNSQK